MACRRRSWKPKTSQWRLYFSTGGKSRGLHKDGMITYRGEALIHVDDIKLHGAHNHENILAAILRQNSMVRQMRPSSGL